MLQFDRGTALVAVLVIFAVSRVLKYINGLQVVNNWPGLRCAFVPFTIFASVFPKFSWNPGPMITWKRRFDLYSAYGTDTISIVPYINGRAEFFTANLDVIRQVVAGGIKSPWIKPEAGSEIVSEWGMNLFVAEREVWQRHRRIIGPAFNNDMYALVWEHSIGFYQDMINHEGWSTPNTVKIPSVQKYTSKVIYPLISDS